SSSVRSEGRKLRWSGTSVMVRYSTGREGWGSPSAAGDGADDTEHQGKQGGQHDVGEQVHRSVLHGARGVWFRQRGSAPPGPPASRRCVCIGDFGTGNRGTRRTGTGRPGTRRSSCRPSPGGSPESGRRRPC